MCSKHKKQLYASRNVAKAAIRSLRDPGMREYQCDHSDHGHWHIGHLPAAVRMGQSTAAEHYAAKEAGMSSIAFSAPEGADQPLTFSPGAENIRRINNSQPAGQDQQDNIETLLTAAEESDVPQARHMAGRIRTLIGDLVTLIRTSAAERELREQIADLTRQRDEAMQKLKDLTGKSGTATVPPSRYEDQAAVRAWAREKGYAVPVRGAMPRWVREAYAASGEAS
jgi:hypothetical protein